MAHTTSVHPCSQAVNMESRTSKNDTSVVNTTREDGYCVVYLPKTKVKLVSMEAPLSRFTPTHRQFQPCLELFLCKCSPPLLNGVAR